MRKTWRNLPCLVKSTLWGLELDMATILVLNSKGQLDALCQSLQRVASDEHQAESLPTVKSVEKRLMEVTTDRVVMLPVAERTGKDRMIAVKRLQKFAADVPIIAVASAGGVKLADAVIAAGATDFLVLGDHLDQRIHTLLGKLQRTLELLHRTSLLTERNATLERGALARFHLEGVSPQMQELRRRIQSVAGIPRPILVVGERGTGKELVARAIHDESQPRGRDAAPHPMITVNCAAFTDALLESELFGHEQGAFTGAHKRQEGKFALAHEGTLFLDEIGHMSLPFQQKILRVVEYGTYCRVGGHTELQTTARIIAATNADLQEKINRGEFLSDLYDRLAFEVIAVPSLRDREGDIDLLARYFLDRFALEIPTLGGKRLANSAIRVLLAYPFPGNVRELKNIIERAACRDTTDEITPEDIGLLANQTPVRAGGDFRGRVDAYKRELLSQALETTGGNQAAAARSLGLSYDQFRHHARKLGVIGSR